MNMENPLLEHPFYQAWNEGEVTVEQLSKYAAAYQTFMDRVPTYWQRVLDELDVDDSRGSEVVEEEREHAELWEEWRIELPETDEVPALEALLEGLEGMSASELAGALHAYEVQQPDVAATKKRGLLEHYGFSESPLSFFDAHIDGEAEHIAFGEAIRAEYADTEGFERGFRRGAELVYRSLDAFC